MTYESRYLGYKGVLMLHPELDRERKHFAQFRSSMKKFSKATNNTFTVVEYSKPYAFGRLNNDIIVLLASLGITNDNLLKKQREYHQWITEATSDVSKAVDFLSCLGKYPLAERVLLEGLDRPQVLREVRSAQRGVISSFRKNDKPKAPIMVHQSRLLFGVCDPFQVLKEGEVFVRVTVGRHGERSVIHGDVLVVRNPCLHPGEYLFQLSF
jgi:regulator of nonsense transcripts 1